MEKEKNKQREETTLPLDLQELSEITFLGCLGHLKYCFPHIYFYCRHAGEFQNYSNCPFYVKGAAPESQCNHDLENFGYCILTPDFTDITLRLKDKGG